MTEKKTSLSKKGSKCHICTGCGRCFGKKQIHTVCDFAYPRSYVYDGKQQSEGTRAEYMVAVDIGTTTIAMQLRALGDGQVADSYTCINPQWVYGADVLSRIEAASDAAVRIKMQEQVRAVLQDGLERFAKVTMGDGRIAGMAIAANTTMIHLLMGYDTEPLGHYPFAPENVAEIRTTLCGMDTVILPGVSAFVGADAVAGVYALSMQERDDIALLVDLGTNGELVLGNREHMLATSTAAGPAFEGDAESFGTDLMKMIARLRTEGLIDHTGLLAEPYFVEGIRIGDVRITQLHIRKLQMAKSAVCTGIRILCEKYGLEAPEKIDKVYLAGGMGYYLDVQAATAIGLLPKSLEKKTVSVGNAALEGAFLYGRGVFGKGHIGKAEFPHIEEFNLATEDAFTDDYISGMELNPCIE